MKLKPQVRLFCMILMMWMVAVFSIHAQHNGSDEDIPAVVQGFTNLGNPQIITGNQLFLNLGITEWHTQSLYGEGRKIGVLDRGFGGISVLEQQFGTTITRYNETTDTLYTNDAINHGTNVTEVILTIAPQSSIFTCRYNTLQDYIFCVDWFIHQQVHIVNHSAGVPALPLDGGSDWSKQVDLANDAGILWINAAGNFAQGLFQDFFTDININGVHEFRGANGVAETLVIPAVGVGAQGIVMLSWSGNNDFVAENIDLDLSVFDETTLNEIASSRRIQDETSVEDALEYVYVDMSRPFAVQIQNVDGRAASVGFSLFIEFAQIPGGEVQRSIIAPADSQSSVTVGALQGFEVAPYSSRGPIVTGTIKPDLVTFGEIQLLDGTPFIGSSAAAPVVAGVAALFWQRLPQLTNDDVRELLIENVMDMGGINVSHGWGRLSLPLPDSMIVNPPEMGAVNSPVSVAPEIFFRDTFDNNRANWEIYTESGLESIIRDGVYHIEFEASPEFEYWLVGPGFNNWVQAPVMNTPYEMRFEVNNFSSTAPAGIAILFDVNDDYLPFKRFFVNSDGTWQLFKWTGERQLLASGFYSVPPETIFNTSTINVNLLVTPDTYTVYMNDNLILQTPSVDPIYGSVGFGLVNSSLRFNSVRADFDNMIVNSLPEYANYQGVGAPPTPTVSALPSIATCSVTISTPSGARTRRGPGTFYDVANPLANNAVLTAQGQRIGEDGFIWWQLLDRTWIRSDVTSAETSCSRLPIVSN